MVRFQTVLNKIVTLTSNIVEKQLPGEDIIPKRLQ